MHRWPQFFASRNVRRHLPKPLASPEWISEGARRRRMRHAATTTCYSPVDSVIRWRRHSIRAIVSAERYSPSAPIRIRRKLFAVSLIFQMRIWLVGIFLLKTFVFHNFSHGETLSNVLQNERRRDTDGDSRRFRNRQFGILFNIWAQVDIGSLI